MFQCPFKPGDVVYCINNRIFDKKEVVFFKFWPKENHPYTVRGVVLNKNGKYGLTLQEIHNPKLYLELYDEFFEPNYAEHRFLGEAMYLDIHNADNTSLLVDALIADAGLTKES